MAAIDDRSAKIVQKLGTVDPRFLGMINKVYILPCLQKVPENDVPELLGDIWAVIFCSLDKFKKGSFKQWITHIVRRQIKFYACRRWQTAQVAGLATLFHNALAQANMVQRVGTARK